MESNEEGRDALSNALLSCLYSLDGDNDDSLSSLDVDVAPPVSVFSDFTTDVANPLSRSAGLLSALELLLSLCVLCSGACVSGR